MISRGTLSTRVVTAPLVGIAVATDGLPAPALVVIGDVVSIRAELERRPRSPATPAAALEHPPDPAHGLSDAVLVLDEGEADEALAAGPEARAR